VAKRDDDRLSPPSDPWAGSASVSPLTSVMPGADHVIVIERPRRRRWPWILGSIVGLTVMCCLAALVVWTPIGREYPAYLDVGHDVAGLTRSDNPDHRLASAELVARMYREENVDDAVATVLTDAKGRVVMLVGATRLIWNPSGELEKAIRSAADRDLRDVTGYPDLGGHITCANTVDDQDQPLVVCAWMDHGSIGLGFYYGSWTMKDCATSLRDIRAAIVRRGNRP
jgi:hypothetical protein